MSSSINEITAVLDQTKLIETHVNGCWTSKCNYCYIVMLYSEWVLSGI